VIGHLVAELQLETHSSYLNTYTQITFRVDAISVWGLLHPPDFSARLLLLFAGKD